MLSPSRITTALCGLLRVSLTYSSPAIRVKHYGHMVLYQDKLKLYLNKDVRIKVIRQISYEAISQHLIVRKSVLKQINMK